MRGNVTVGALRVHDAYGGQSVPIKCNPLVSALQMLLKFVIAIFARGTPAWTIVPIVFLTYVKREIPQAKSIDFPIHVDKFVFAVVAPVDALAHSATLIPQLIGCFTLVHHSINVNTLSAKYSGLQPIPSHAPRHGTTRYQDTHLEPDMCKTQRDCRVCLA